MHTLLTGTPGGEECKHVPGNTCKRSLVSERMDPFRNNIEGRFTVSGPASEMTLQQTSLTKLSSFDLLGGSSPVAPASSNKIHGKEVCQSSSQVDEQDLCQSKQSVQGSLIKFFIVLEYFEGVSSKHSTFCSRDYILVTNSSKTSEV